MGELLVQDFSGGLNLRDAPNQLGPGETPSMFNFVITERGALKRRNGCFNVGALPGVSTKPAFVFWSDLLGFYICARETAGAPNTLKIHTSSGGATGTWTDRGTINSDVAAEAAFVDFPGATPKVVIVSDKNGGATKGVFTLDGAFTLANVSTTVAGNAIALWQDRAWIGGYPTNDANGTLPSIFYSAPKDPTAWSNANQQQQLREIDAKRVTGFGVAGGALIAFKKTSTYRLIDSASGAYQTIDTAVGCVNPRAVAALSGRLFVWAADGIYETDGSGRSHNIGDKLRPIFLGPFTSGITVQSSIIAGVFEDQVVFAGTIGGPFTSAPRMFQYDPETRGWVQLVLPSASQNEFSSFTVKDGTLYAACTDGDDLFRMFTETAGSDAGTGYSSSWQTPWLLPNGGQLVQLQRARLQGVKNGNVDVLVSVGRDWDFGAPDTFDLTTALTPSGSAVQAFGDIQSLGHSAAFAFIFLTDTDTGDLSIRALQLFDVPLAEGRGYPRTTRSDSRGGGNTPPPGPPPGM